MFFHIRVFGRLVVIPEVQRKYFSLILVMSSCTQTSYVQRVQFSTATRQILRSKQEQSRVHWQFTARITVIEDAILTEWVNRGTSKD
jgi:hypothetical protein